MNSAVFERAALKALMALPGPVLDRLSAGLETLGRSHLDSRIRFLLALSSAKPTLNSGTVGQARCQYRQDNKQVDVQERPRPVAVSPRSATPAR